MCTVNFIKTDSICLSFRFAICLQVRAEDPKVAALGGGSPRARISVNIVPSALSRGARAHHRGHCLAKNFKSINTLSKHVTRSAAGAEKIDSSDHVIIEWQERARSVSQSSGGVKYLPFELFRRHASRRQARRPISFPSARELRPLLTPSRATIYCNV